MAEALAAVLYQSKSATAGTNTNHAAALPPFQEMLEQLDNLWTRQAMVDDAEVAATTQEGAMMRLVVTADGWDPRMELALNRANDLLQAALQAACGGASRILQANHTPNLKHVLLLAITQRLEALHAAANSVSSSNESVGMTLAVAYRERQRQLLRTCCSKLESMSTAFVAGGTE